MFVCVSFYRMADISREILKKHLRGANVNKDFMHLCNLKFGEVRTDALCLRS